MEPQPRASGRSSKPIIKATEILLWKEISGSAGARASESAEAGDIPASLRFMELHVLARKNIDILGSAAFRPYSDFA